jgi:hypothetical protein
VRAPFGARGRRARAGRGDPLGHRLGFAGRCRRRGERQQGERGG